MISCLLDGWVVGEEDVCRGGEERGGEERGGEGGRDLVPYFPVTPTSVRCVSIGKGRR